MLIARAYRSAKARLGGHANSDRLAVEQPVIRRFDRVTERVPEVQVCTDAAFALIDFDHRGFQRDISPDEVARRQGIEALQPRCIAGEQRAHVISVPSRRRPLNYRVLDDLTPTGSKLSFWQRPQKIGVDNHQLRLQECADQVLARPVINPRFAADAAVDRREQAGRDLHEANAAQDCRGNETGQIAHDATTERDNDITPFDPIPKHPVVELAGRVEALAPFTRRNALAAYSKPCLPKRVLDGRAMDRGDIPVRHDPDLSGTRPSLAQRMAYGQDRTRRNGYLRRSRVGGKSQPHWVARSALDDALKFGRDVDWRHRVDRQRQFSAVVYLLALPLEALNARDRVVSSQKRPLNRRSFPSGLLLESIQDRIWRRIERQNQCPAPAEMAFIPRFAGDRGASTCRHHDALSCQQGTENCALAASKRRLTMVTKNGGDRRVPMSLDLFIDISRGPAKTIGQEPRHRRLARSAESDQDNSLDGQFASPSAMPKQPGSIVSRQWTIPDARLRRFGLPMTDSRRILALDQGTTSSRAMLFDDRGRQCSVAQQATTQIYPRPGWVNQDANEIWQTTLSTARDVLAGSDLGSSSIAAIGITNQRETLVVWDRQTSQPMCPAIVWQSRQSLPQVEGILARGMDARYAEVTGLVPDAYFTATKLAWLLEDEPELRQKADAGEILAGTIDSWLIWNLTGGAVHATDVTNASRTMLFDIHAMEWAPDLLADLNIPGHVLPRVEASTGPFGSTTPELFGAEIPIRGVAGDQQAALFGQTCFIAGETKNTYGTGSFLLMNTGAEAKCSANRLLSTVAWQIGSRVTYALEGAVFVSGAAVQWLRDGLGIIASSGDVELLAASVPDSGGVAFVPALTGLGAPHWDPAARGTIVGLTRGTTRAHIARATLEAIAMQVCDVIDGMTADSGVPLTSLRVDGGAARNDLLMQIQADALGVPVIRPKHVESTAVGAAYLAGLGAGIWPDETSLRELWEVDRVFEPHGSASTRESNRARWRRAVDRSRGWAE